VQSLLVTPEDGCQGAVDCPAVHAVHDASPGAAVICPAGQVVQLAVPVENWPASQVVHAVWPNALAVPGAQAVHSWKTVADWNLPAGQCSQETAAVAAVKLPSPQITQAPAPEVGM